MGNMGQQQYGYNMGQVSQANQQQQFESVQRQLQQLKVCKLDTPI